MTILKSFLRHISDLEAEFGFLTKLNDSTTMKGKCYAGTEEFILPICSKYCNNNRKIDYNSKYPGRTEWVEIQLTNEISLERVPREAITNFSLRM